MRKCQLDIYCKQADFVFNLAGVNRLEFGHLQIDKGQFVIKHFVGACLHQLHFMVELGRFHGSGNSVNGTWYRKQQAIDSIPATRV